MEQKFKSYDIKNCDHKDITEIMKNSLERLSFNTRTAKLGKSIIKINYYDTAVDENLQRENKILILQDPNNDCHINFKGKLNDSQISQLWEELNRNMRRSVNNIGIMDNQLSREDATYLIINKIEEQGYEIDNMRAIEFIENFQNRYNRLPYENEIQPIVKGYILTQSSIIKKETLVSNEYNFPKQSFAPSKALVPEKPINVEKISVDKSIPDFTRNENSNFISHDPSPNTIIIKEAPSGLLTIQKPTGRRICPNCGNSGEYKIHEQIDKTNMISLFPRIYGKLYTCDGCRMAWKEE
ncbi:MAG: hypothetical protein ACFFAS_19570 [Promethearchaeota archaeon]